VQRLLDPQPLESVGLGLVLSVVSSVLNGAAGLGHAAQGAQHRSMALEADARHLFTDVWTSAGVVVGLLAVQATGWLWLDPLIAIAVALNILREGGWLVCRSADGLMDRPEPEVRAQIDQVAGEASPPDHPLRPCVTRRAGQRRFVDLHMHMPAGWTLGRAAALRTGRAGADERGAGPARHDPAAAHRRGGALRRPEGPAVIAWCSGCQAA
jgi:cation diffusion facilitator family transporter